MRLLADECCPRAIVVRLRTEGYDVRYAAEDASSAQDRVLLQVALAERRLIVTEDFDFGELLIRDRLSSIGAIVLFMPKLTPQERAARLSAAFTDPSLDFENKISIVEPQRVRQRRLFD